MIFAHTKKQLQYIFIYTHTHSHMRTSYSIHVVKNKTFLFNTTLFCFSHQKMGRSVFRTIVKLFSMQVWKYMCNMFMQFSCEL